MEVKTNDAESIASIIKAVDDAKKKDGVDKFFDWIMRLAMGLVIFFGTNLVNKVDETSDQINKLSNKIEILQNDNEYLRRDLSKVESSMDKLTQGK